jgi:hypothetical protein
MKINFCTRVLQADFTLCIKTMTLIYRNTEFVRLQARLRVNFVEGGHGSCLKTPFQVEFSMPLLITDIGN